MADEQALVMEGILQKKSPKGLIKKVCRLPFFLAAPTHECPPNPRKPRCYCFCYYSLVALVLNAFLAAVLAATLALMFIFKAWQSRYFKLKQSSLEYFKKQSDAKSQGLCIPLSTYLKVLPSPPHTFLLSSGEIPLFMVTSVVVPKGKKDGRFGK
jgi:hypothetical protein